MEVEGFTERACSAMDNDNWWFGVAAELQKDGAEARVPSGQFMGVWRFLILVYIYIRNNYGILVYISDRLSV